MTERKPKSSEAWWINIVGHDKPRIAHYRGPDHDIPAYWQYMEREVDVEDVTPLTPVLPYELQLETVAALESMYLEFQPTDYDSFETERNALATLAKIEALTLPASAAQP